MILTGGKWAKLTNADVAHKWTEVRVGNWMVKMAPCGIWALAGERGRESDKRCKACERAE